MTATVSGTVPFFLARRTFQSSDFTWSDSTTPCWPSTSAATSNGYPFTCVDNGQHTISPALPLYNSKSGLMVCCPLSTQVKGYPFEVAALVDGQPGVVLSDQVKSLDWKVRRAKKKGTVTGAVVAEVRAKIKALLQIK